MQEFIISTPSELKAIFEAFQSNIISAIQNISNGSIKLPQKEYLTAKEVASLLGISLTTIHDWSKKGILKKQKIGRTIRFKSNEVQSALIRIEAKRSNSRITS